MAASTGKTLGLIILIALIVLIAWRITPLLLAPFGMITGATHIFRFPKLESFRFGPDFIHISSFSVLTLFLFILWIAVIVWVYRDAERRGMNGILWALLVLIGNLIGLLIYLIVRSDTLGIVQDTTSGPTTYSCPKCQEPVGRNFIYCPHCGTSLQNICPECKKSVEANWKLCPHCGKKLK